MTRPSRAAVFLLLFLPGCTHDANSGSESVTPSAYCAQIASYAATCHLSDPCTAASLAQCSALASTASAARLAAGVACLAALACVDAGASPEAACVQAQVGNAALSVAQTKLAEDTCAACPVSGLSTAACVANFYAQGVGRSCSSDADCPGAIPGACQHDVCTAPPGGEQGTLLLGLSDAIVNDVDAKCLPQAGSDAGALTCAALPLCVSVAIDAVVPPTPIACGGAPSAGGG